MSKWTTTEGYAVLSVFLVVASWIVKVPGDPLITGPRLVQFVGAGVVLVAALTTAIELGQLRKPVHKRRLATLGGGIWVIGMLIEFTA